MAKLPALREVISSMIRPHIVAMQFNNESTLKSLEQLYVTVEDLITDFDKKLQNVINSGGGTGEDITDVMIPYASEEVFGISRYATIGEATKGETQGVITAVILHELLNELSKKFMPVNSTTLDTLTLTSNLKIRDRDVTFRDDIRSVVPVGSNDLVTERAVADYVRDKRIDYSKGIQLYPDSFTTPSDGIIFALLRDDSKFYIGGNRIPLQGSYQFPISRNTIISSDKMLDGIFYPYENA